MSENRFQSDNVFLISTTKFIQYNFFVEIPKNQTQNLYQGIHDILGDGRASEQPGLTAIHTIFLREHNRLVEGLRGVNPHWDADLLFEHARRILAASFSQIIYNEFLPRLLSWNAVNLYGLKLLPAGNLFFVIKVLFRQNVSLFERAMQVF